ncbi:MAG: STAS domain-containing protein [Kiritimatiellia bacterium]|jgi:anti-sigma B factor antagonist|nr:STAS domain-containing protein [Kiritimatiellia bacterium]
MTLTKQQEGANLTVAVEGRLDTVTAPQLEEALKTSLDGVTRLTLDFSRLVYVSSAGLRVILTAQKRMAQKGKMVVKNLQETVREVFEVTGFTGILTIE